MHHWDFAPVWAHADLLALGLLNTLKVTATALACGIPLGLLLALMRLSPNGPQEFPPMTTYQSDGMQSSHWLQMRTDQSGTTKNDSARNPPVSGR